MEWLVDNLYLILVCVSLLLNIVIFVVGKISGGKNTKLLTALNTVSAALPDVIAMAEKVGATGEERKDYAMRQVKLLCQAVGLTPTEDQLAKFSAAIDELVSLTKSINNKPSTTIKPLGVRNGN